MAKAKITTKLCPKQVACDGASMMSGREMCARCADKLRKRAKEREAQAQSIGGRP